jgi:flagellin
MISLQTNVASLVAQQNLNTDNNFQNQTIEELTSGYRINSSGDDAAGLAVANQDLSQIAQLTQGVSNGTNAVAQLQIMDGGMSNISQILDRLQTLATESASGTFTGDRTTLNNEFQTDIQEIDRQAQSIGLNTGGTFAQNLNVFLGEGSGSQSLSNALVGLNLSQATVDSQSLGLSGYQAIAGTADLSDSSATSVSNILANTTNQAGELVQGDATFDFSGSGFSGLQVNVNLSGVSDVNTLVNNINAAIQSAAAGSSASAAAFKAAGISASVNVASNGTEQLAFTSSTGAFQVQAGDQMANALMGNFSSGTTGASLTPTITGQVAATSGTLANNTYVQVSGGGMSSPVTITLNSGTAIGTAITDLKNGVNTNSSLEAAGISVAQNSAGQLVFTDANDSPFQVTASGDTSNLLGLGSYLSSGGAATYTSITAGTAYATAGALTDSSADAQTTLEFSVNGGAAVDLSPIALDAGVSAGGDATESNTTGDVNLAAGATIVTGVNNQLSFNVGGVANTVNVTLNASTPATVTGGADPTPANVTAGGSFLLGLDGGPLQTITMTGGDSSLADVEADLQAAINTAFAPNGDVPQITVGTNGGALTLTDTSGNVSSPSSIDIEANPADTGSTIAALGFTSNEGVTNGTPASAGSIATEIQDAANTQLASSGLGVTVTVNNSNQIVITSNNAGAATGYQVSAVTGDGATSIFGGGQTQNAGQNRSLTNLVSAINQEIQNNSTLTAAGIQASDNAGKLEFSSTNNTSFQLNAGASPQDGTVTGTVDLTNGGNFATSPVTLSLKVNGTTENVTLNQNESNASAIASAINQQLTGATASVVQANGKQYLQITDGTQGATDGIQVLSGTANSVLGLTAGTYNGANEGNVGFGVSNISNAGSLGVASASSSLSAVNAGGTSQTGPISFTALAADDGTQALTISAVDGSGVTQSATITLAATGDGTVSLGNSGSASSISNAVNYINQELQKTDNPTLQGIVAVEQNVNGVNEINFMSPTNTFQVAIGTNANGGLNGGTAETATGQVTGQGGTISIATQGGAEAAVTAVTNAVSSLGLAQAVVGKGEDQLNYAINLANSQITNTTVAEGDIMDADVAQEAANLSKAQVLNQAAIAAMAQANSAPQNVLTLLRQ